MTLKDRDVHLVVGENSNAIKYMKVVRKFECSKRYIDLVDEVESEWKNKGELSSAEFFVVANDGTFSFTDGPDQYLCRQASKTKPIGDNTVIIMRVEEKDWIDLLSRLANPSDAVTNLGTVNIAPLPDDDAEFQTKVHARSNVPDVAVSGGREMTDEEHGHPSPSSIASENVAGTRGHLVMADVVPHSTRLQTTPMSASHAMNFPRVTTQPANYMLRTPPPREMVTALLRLLEGCVYQAWCDEDAIEHATPGEQFFQASIAMPFLKLVCETVMPNADTNSADGAPIRLEVFDARVSPMLEINVPQNGGEGEDVVYKGLTDVIIYAVFASEPSGEQERYVPILVLELKSIRHALNLSCLRQMLLETLSESSRGFVRDEEQGQPHQPGDIKWPAAGEDATQFPEQVAGCLWNGNGGTIQFWQATNMIRRVNIVLPQGDDAEHGGLDKDDGWSPLWKAGWDIVHYLAFQVERLANPGDKLNTSVDAAGAPYPTNAAAPVPPAETDGNGAAASAPPVPSTTRSGVVYGPVASVAKALDGTGADVSVDPNALVQLVPLTRSGLYQLHEHMQHEAYVQAQNMPPPSHGRGKENAAKVTSPRRTEPLFARFLQELVNQKG